MSGIRVLIVGAGASGLAMAARLKQDGVTDVLVVDRAEGVGGVWRANTYPGAACDIPSHLYSLSFHPNPGWSRRYAGQAEITAYFEDVARAFDLGPHLRLGTEVVHCAWDDDARVWSVTLRDAAGTEVREAEIVITATGQLSVPSVPSVDGAASFAGEVFHSARWDHDVDLTGKRVAVIGTGASAVQFVPPVAAEAAHVDLYQRSPAYTLAKRDRAYSAPERAAYRHFPWLLRASRWRQYFMHESTALPFVLFPPLMFMPKRFSLRHLRRGIADPALREKLTPDYRMGCKRIMRTDDWYATMSRPNLDLVTDRISRIVPEGVVTADGEVHPADVLIYGTGFAATEFLTPMTVTGAEGRDLEKEWAGGARAYLGSLVPGFPNFFLLYGPGTNLGHNSVLQMIEPQIAWIRGAVEALRQGDLPTVDVRPELQTRYDAWFRRASSHTVWETGDCSSWYLADGRNTNNWPAGVLRYRLLMRKFDRTITTHG